MDGLICDLHSAAGFHAPVYVAHAMCLSSVQIAWQPNCYASISRASHGCVYAMNIVLMQTLTHLSGKRINPMLAVPRYAIVSGITIAYSKFHTLLALQFD